MMRLFALLSASIVAAGCRAPAPQFNPLAPYGKTTVAPPPTGSYGSPNSYYQQPPAPGVGANNTTTPLSRAAAETAVAAAPAPVGASSARSKASSPTGGVAQASYSSEARNLGGGETVRVTERSTAAASSAAPLQLRGMPINDATDEAAAAPPASFVPQGQLLELSQLPQPGAAPAPPLRIRGLPPATAGEIGTSVTTGNRAAAPADGRWRSRYTPGGALHSPLAQNL